MANHKPKGKKSVKVIQGGRVVRTAPYVCRETLVRKRAYQALGSPLFYRPPRVGVRVPIRPWPLGG